MTIKEQLYAKHCEIFQNKDYIDLLQKIRGSRDYSDLFLSSCADNYAEAKNKIMVVGRETRGWTVTSKENPQETDTVDKYLDKSMSTNRSWVAAKKKLRGKGFFNFYHAIEKKCGSDGIVWGNTYAVDYKKSHPRRGKKNYAMVENLSRDLLLAQIEVLQPEIIIFCGGGSSVKSRRKYLEQDQGKNKNEQEDFEGIDNRYLWKFKLDNGTLCYRIQHPSRFSSVTIHARKHLLNLLPEK